MLEVGETNLTPATHFKRKATGEISLVCADLAAPQCRSSSPVATNRSLTHAQKLGLVYEAKVFAYLSKQFKCVPQCPIHYQTTTIRRSIVPDLLLFSRDCWDLTVVEVKRNHSADGYNQLRFYLPIVEKAFPWAKVNLLEVCANYHEVTLPVYECHVLGAEQVFNLSRTTHNVWLLSERQLKVFLGAEKHARLGDRPP